MNLTAPDKIANYIGGQHMAPINGRYLDNINPATGAVYSHTPDSDASDVAAAVAAAEAAIVAGHVSLIHAHFHSGCP
jgi:aminomuconate-semialdehyde/2-hydroxymuconate-6-semialdehyde dehydrogenase